MTLSPAELKDRYADQWGLGNQRVEIVQKWLALFGIASEKVGHGTDTSGRIEGFHASAGDRFDLYAPLCDTYFEVTGTDWLKSASGKRYGKPMLTVLKAKVDSAKYYNLDGKLLFAYVADIMGEVRFMPCPKVPWYSLCHYEQGGGAYYAVPWDDWMKPCFVLPRLVKASLKARCGK